MHAGYTPSTVESTASLAARQTPTETGRLLLAGMIRPW
jgi:hypothetical protein